MPADASSQHHMTPLRVQELSVGDDRTTLLLPELTRTHIVMYAGASGDFNPLHTDERYATEAAGFPSVFAHGMLTMGMTARVLTDWVGNSRLLTFGVRFTRQVWPGDSLRARAVVTAIHTGTPYPTAEFSVVTTNQDDADVITGYATARLDP